MDVTSFEGNEMNTRTDRIDAGNGQQFDAYVSIPPAPNGHAIIVLQEIFGVTPAIRGVADRFAAEGYLAFAPDLFWRMEPGLQLTHSKEDMARAFGFMEKFDENQSIEDIARVAAHIRALPGFNGRVAAAGMCLGGKLAYLASARTDIDAAVSFYGVGIEKNLSEAGQLRCPLMLHFGGRDKYVPQEVRARIAEALKANAQAPIHLYADADHGFYTRGDAETIEIAHQRTTEFLKRSLGTVTSR
jgi:carboxymethylenebutenolidase